MSAPSRPRSPYISLDDPHTKDFFTKSRIKNHLRRAGLLNKHGEILTKAEYESKQTDVAIGRENRRKIDDAIMEVLNDMAREHWAHVRDYTESLEKDRMNLVRRIENQYRRRTQPITIRHSSDGRIRLDTTEPIIDNHSDVSENSTRPLTGTLPPVRTANPPLRPQSSHPSTTRRPTDLDSIRQELNNIKNKIANLEKKLNTDERKNESDGGLQKFEQLLANLEEQQKILNRKHEEEKQRIDEFLRQRKPHDGPTISSGIDKQQIEHFIQISTVIKELHDRILTLETSFRPLSTGLSQGAIDQAIKISEKKTIDRERVIENLVHGIDDKIKQMESQFVQLLTRLDRLPNSITYADANQLIQNEIKNFKRTQQDNHEWQNLAGEAITKVNHLEYQLNQFFQSTGDKTARPAVEELVERPTSTQRPVSQPNTNFESRFNDLERRLNSIPPPPNLDPIEKRLTQLENHPRNMDDPRIALLQDQIRDNSGQIQSLQGQIAELDRRKLDLQEIPRILGDIEHKSQQKLDSLFDTIMSHLKEKPDHEMVNRLIQDSERRTSQQLDALQKSVKENQRALKNIEDYLNDLHHRFNQQPTITSAINSKPDENPVTDKPTSKELQAIMPFIELLPTFDMLDENEWI